MDVNHAAIRRHLDFWERRNNSALVGKIPFTGWRRKPFPSKRGSVTSPQRIEAADFDVAAYIGADSPLPQWQDDDLIPFAACAYPQAWMEGIIGCSLYASDVSLSAKPVDNPDVAFDSERALDGPYARLFADVETALIKRAAGAVPVCQPHIRGVVDMAAAYLGEEELCLGVMDDPDKIAALCRSFAGLVIHFARSSLERRGRFCGGYASTWSVFSGEPLLDYQIDASSLFSADMYERHFLPIDDYILSAFPAQVLHLHACGLNHATSLARLTNLKCVEITLEREVPGYSFERIKKAVDTFMEADKRVIINGELSEAELEQYLAAFRPEGLAIFYWAPLE